MVAIAFYYLVRGPGFFFYIFQVVVRFDDLWIFDLVGLSFCLEGGYICSLIKNAEYKKGNISINHALMQQS